ncbi:MAG: thiamine/thiamine pyrophosphate ABC transporter permease, partial [Cellvibrionaceae bacterium]|nr:thiamine/thiamine pyrophosphate ABC transporter permease [Cellvibrionaceae bacterium]
MTLFSLKQAFLSTLLSLLGAIPIALALYRRRFWGRRWLLRLCAMTFVLPVLVAVFGIVAIYGNSGWLLRLFAWQDFSIYGLSGILLAHVFLNLPLSVRIFIQALETIPTQQHQLAYHLGMGAWTRFKLIEWPAMQAQLLSIASLVFMLCFTSFAIVMALGGGPKATTIELAIYQAIHYDFDLAFAAILGLWQILLTLLFSLLVQRITKKRGSGAMPHRQRPIFVTSKWLNIWDSLWIGVCLLLLLPPLVAVVFAGINPRFWMVVSDSALWSATYHSLSIALCSALLALGCGVSILLTSRIYRLKKAKRSADYLEFSAMLILVTPSVVLSTGLFLLLNRFSYAPDYAFALVIVVNTLMALPYVIKSLSVPLFSLAQRFEPLCISLGMK